MARKPVAKIVSRKRVRKEKDVVKPVLSRGEFLSHLEKSSEEVSGWPEWKKHILGKRPVQSSDGSGLTYL